MEIIEGKVLEFLNKECELAYILRELNIKEENLADIIIGLEDKELVGLRDKKWVLTGKGRNIFERRDKSLKKLKIDYLYGELENREDYNNRIKELENIIQFMNIAPEETASEETESTIPEPISGIIEEKDIQEKQQQEIIQVDTSIKPEKTEDKPKKICKKCGTDNKLESNFCRKCGSALNI